MSLDDWLMVVGLPGLWFMGLLLLEMSVWLGMRLWGRS
jgi:hypothetical protein